MRKPSFIDHRAIRSAIAALVLLAIVLPFVPTNAAGPPLYPDLVTPAPAGLRVTREWLNGAYHYLLRFDNTVANQGGRLELTANLAVSRDVYQNVYDARIGGTRVERTRVGSDLIFHPQHNHFHFEGIASYEILQKSSNGRYLPTEFRGTKTSYCIIDYVRISSTARTTPQYEFCNASVQGLSAGWGDLYYSSLPEQWVDFGTSMLADGDYALQSIANPQRKIRESNSSNNTGVRYFSIRNGALVTSGQSPSCVATPASVKVGDTVQLSCTRITAGTTVDIRWGFSTGGPILTTVVSAADHKALASVTIPSASSGAYPIFAVVRSTGSYYGAVVNVGASLTVSPQNLSPGGMINYVAKGYSGGETVSIRLDGTQITTKTAGSDGTAAGSFVLPPVTGGSHTVSAVGGTSGGTASATISAGPGIALNPAFAHVETAIAPTLTGFQSGESVSIAIQNGPTLGAVTVNSSGGASGSATSVTLPTSVQPGNVSIVATGQTSGTSASTALLVLAAGANTPTSTATSTSTSTASPQLDLRRVTTALNLRSGAGTSFSIIQVLPQNTIVTVTGTGQNAGGTIFVPIRLQSGVTGWVAERYLEHTTPTATATARGSVTATATSGAVTSMETTTRVNLRTGPGTTFTAIEILPAGTLVTITGPGQAGGGYTWLPVRKSNGTTGWVASLYLRAVAGPQLPTGTATATSEATSAQTAISAPVAPIRLDENVLRWMPEILAASQASGIPSDVIAGVIRMTSGGDPNVTGENGSSGLMLVAPQEFAALGISSGWHDSAINIAAGSSTLASLLAAHGSIEAALAAYFGDGCTDQGYCSGNFVSDVLTAAAQYRPALENPGTSGLNLLPSGWSAPAVAPYVIAGQVRPIAAPAEALEPISTATAILPTATSEPTIEIPTEVPVEEPVKDTGSDPATPEE